MRFLVAALLIALIGVTGFLPQVTPNPTTGDDRPDRADLTPTASNTPSGGFVYLPAILVPGDTATPTPTATATRVASPTPTHTPTHTPTPTATTPSSGFVCSSDTYNCTDFTTQSLAQEVFDYCVAQGAGDIHRLDRDNNGIACESLPPGFAVIR